MSLVYVITGFACCIKAWVTVIWGSFPLTHSSRGSGVRLGSRGSSPLSSGSEHRGTLLLGSPSPWMLLWTTSVEYYFCVSHKRRPVCIQAALVISYYKCVGIEGTAPGVEQGKELSLSAEEQSSPESHSLQAGTDGPWPITFWVGPEFGSHRLRVTFVQKQCGSFPHWDGTHR